MIAWLSERVKEPSAWMGIFSLAGAVGLAVTLKHKELIYIAAVAVIAAIAAMMRDKHAAEQ